VNATALIRWSTVAAVAGIAGVAGWVSYEHALMVVRAHGESGAVAAAYPVTVDGLIYSASMVLLDSARRGVRAPALARWLLAVGIGATLVANVAAGIRFGMMGAVVAAWPALALVGSYELLMLIIRRETAPAAVTIPTGETATETVTGDVAGQVTIPASARGNATVPARERATEAVASTPARSARGRTSRSARGKRPAKRGDVTPEAAETAFADLLATGEVPSIRAIRRELPVGEPKAKLIRSHLENVAAGQEVMADV
jgi:hypothetical protein